MKIYIHAGIEKTGSSHLQSLCAINRESLLEQGIWFPAAAKNDVELTKGEISAGNAQSLTDYLNSFDFENTKLFMKNHLEEAVKRKCQKLLLSNELLLIALSEEKKLREFDLIIKDLNVVEVSLLVVLRDPLDQALSLYKHRAKSGRALEIEEWPKKNYVYGNKIKLFFNNLEKYNYNLSVRKFLKKNMWLEKIFFSDWLKLEIELTQPPKVVNPSLSLSELLLIKKIRKYQPKLVSKIYNRFIKLNKREKAEDSTIEKYHNQILYDYLIKYCKTWDLCNTFLYEEEALVFENPNFENKFTQKKVTSFSDTQLDVLASIVSESFDPFFWFKFQNTKLKLLLSKVLYRLKLK